MDSRVVNEGLLGGTKRAFGAKYEDHDSISLAFVAFTQAL
jgi:hypothetical protein